MKRIIILGSTGSIGQNTLRVIRAFSREFEAVGLSAYSNTATLLKQVEQFNPQYICLVDKLAASKARSKLPSSCNLLSGQEGLEDLIHKSNAEIVVLAIEGADALIPLIEAIRCKKTIILANKEALVIAGSIIMDMAKENKVKIFPVDSEQSAIWQCLEARDKRQVKRIYLTASGGPFKDYNLGQLKKIGINDVLTHPCWSMGKKITVDSATLMNKGLEIIEAMWLFDLRLPQISVVIHPESVVHSMVEFCDGVILAQISITDMRIPIQYALTYPNRLENSLPSLDFFKLKKLNFQRPNMKRFPCLALAINAAEEGGSMPCVLNAADEIAVSAFLNKRIDFVDIPKVVRRVMDRHKKIANPTLQEILFTDNWARAEAGRSIKN